MGHRVQQDRSELLTFPRCLSASELLDRACPFYSYRDKAAHCFQRLTGEERTGNAHAAHDAHAHPKGHKCQAMLSADLGFTPHAGQLQIVYLQAVARWPGPIDVGPVGEGNSGRLYAERLHDVSRNSVQELGHVVAREQLLTEII